ncbi:DUF6710 family protein [Pseudomonas sp. MLB6B]
MSSSVTEFENVIRWARMLADDANREGLEDLIKIVLRPVQADHMRAALIRPKHCAPESLSWIRSMGGLWQIPTAEGTLLSHVTKYGRQTVDKSHTVRLWRDVVLPTIWSSSSIESSLGAIGPGRSCGRFTQDSNHRVTLMIPLGIGWVSGGNHSITQGILSGEGEIVPDEVIDVSSAIDAVRYDGECWVCMSSGLRTEGPLYREFGWVWEIARLLSKRPNASAD